MTRVEFPVPTKMVEYTKAKLQMLISYEMIMGNVFRVVHSYSHKLHQVCYPFNSKFCKSSLSALLIEKCVLRTILRSLWGNFLATARMSSKLLLLVIAAPVAAAQLAMTALRCPTHLLFWVRQSRAQVPGATNHQRLSQDLLLCILDYAI